MLYTRSDYTCRLTTSLRDTTSRSKYYAKKVWYYTKCGIYLTMFGEVARTMRTSRIKWDGCATVNADLTILLHLPTRVNSNN